MSSAPDLARLAGLIAERAAPRPAPRFALRREDAARELGVSVDTFDRYVRDHLPAKRLGTVTVYPVAGILAFLAGASSPLEGVKPMTNRNRRGPNP